MVHLTTRGQWRRWLAAHHANEDGVWLVNWRAGTGKPRVSYNDAVEEALCFGWIDSNQRAIDDERVAQRFTPRRRPGGFSEMNRQRARRMMQEGKMTPAGMALSGDAWELRPFPLPPG